MIDFEQATIQHVSVHSVGNKTNNEDLHLSKENLDITGSNVRELLFNYFLTPFAEPEFHNFTFSNGDFTLNPLYNFASKIFENANQLHTVSVDIAKYLYELSVHPQIKSGDLFVAFFNNANIEGNTTSAVGIFKAENRQSFLKVDRVNGEFAIESDDGINIEKLDKGCIIFDVEKEDGYKVCIIDKSNRGSEAQYWRDNFLEVRPCNDNFHQTKNLMTIAKNFVTKKLTEEFNVTKADQIDFLNRSVDYFKNNETFDQDDFGISVFNNEEINKSFKNFDQIYRDAHEMEISDEFEISSQAVKKQAKVFKSVLKLDKNFHIYIHGDRKLIEQGTDQDGRKFYKIYFDKEA